MLLPLSTRGGLRGRVPSAPPSLKASSALITKAMLKSPRPAAPTASTSCCRCSGLCEAKPMKGGFMTMMSAFGIPSVSASATFNSTATPL